MATDLIKPSLLRKAKALPEPLVRFLAKYPPPALQSAIPKPAPLPDLSSLSLSTPTASGSSAPEPSTSTDAPLTPPPDRNPFKPWKNPNTGRWRPPVYSLRKQRELCKMAAEHGVEELLWESTKATWYKETKLIEQGLRLRNAGPGKRVKGHKWERTLSTRLEERRQAMLNMPAMIEEWKRLGHGRGWKKWPK